MQSSVKKNKKRLTNGVGWGISIETTTDMNQQTIMYYIHNILNGTRKVASMAEAVQVLEAVEFNAEKYLITHQNYEVYTAIKKYVESSNK